MKSRVVIGWFQFRIAVAGLLMLSVWLLFPGGAQASGFTYGAVVALQGTPHLWIADEQGVLHWGGDTRGLSGHYVDWGNRVEVSVSQLQSFRRANPCLGHPILVGMGDVERSRGDIALTSEALHVRGIG